MLTIALIATGTLALRHLRETAPPVEALQFTIPAPENSQFGGPPGGGTGVATQLAISPDGRQIVFVAKTQETYALWLRSISTLATRQLPGTEGAAFPFWSPDSRYIGFFAGGKLKKVAAAGGPPIVLCDASAGRGGTWSPHNVIVFTPNTTGPLLRVSSAGGIPVTASAVDTSYGETNHRFPHFLPDGRHFLYTGSVGTCCPASKPARIRIAALDATDAATLLAVESAVSYATGHLLYVRDGTLLAHPFDPGDRQLKGEPFPVAEIVGTEGSRLASFSVSDTGTLVYARRTVSATSRLTWFDRAGKRIGTLGEAGAYGSVALSPDERRVAVAMQTGSPANRDVWIIDVARGVSSRLTFDPADEMAPVWSPDSTRVAFQSLRPAELGLRVKSASGATKDEPLLTIDPQALSGFGNVPFANDWSADGRFLAYDSVSVGSGIDLWLLPLTRSVAPGRQSAGGVEPQTSSSLVKGTGQQTRAAFSPDVRWVAYTSDESSVAQVYVQPFPPTGGRFQVSRDGGIQPMWRGDGKELFFLAFDGTLMAAPINIDREFQAGIPTALFDSGATAASRRQYAVTRDGKRFLAIVPDRGPVGLPLTVVVNWLAAVQK